MERLTVTGKDVREAAAIERVDLCFDSGSRNSSSRGLYVSGSGVYTVTVGGHEVASTKDPDQAAAVFNNAIHKHPDNV